MHKAPARKMARNLARKATTAASVCALALALAGAATAQQGPNANGAPTPAPAAASANSAAPAPLSRSTYSADPGGNTFLDSSAEIAQPTSLAEAARLARAKKQAAAATHGPKAQMLIDDDNMAHGGEGISVVGDSNSSAPGGASGAPVYSGKHSGKLVLYDFWATWCGPCRESLPDLKQFQATYGPSQVEVISVSADNNEAAWRSFVQQNGMNWEQRIDTGGQLRRQYGVTALPTYVLTDSSGHVIQRVVGEDPEVPLANRLAPGLGSLQESGSPSVRGS